MPVLEKRLNLRMIGNYTDVSIIKTNYITKYAVTWSPMKKEI